MNGGKLILIVAAFAAIGLLVLPSTVSLFHGQHIWYNISDGKYLPCKKCHADVYEELEQSAFHKDLESGIGTGPNKADDGDCYACHRANASITYANVTTDYTQYTPGKEAHAASTVACMLCHEANASEIVRTIPGFFAGGFNVTRGSGTYPGLGSYYTPFNYTKPGHPGGHDAHDAFIIRAIIDDTMEDANEACVACHTWTPVRINWSHALSLEFNATYEKDLKLPPTHYNVTAWFVNGTYPITVWGNASGYGNTNGTNWPGWSP